jgi:UDP-N-acetylmuramoyl-tripeptide--D-alanyl-D-alanine ligase
MMQIILSFKLRLLARLYLWRYRPVIVAITGNAGKTTTKEAVTAVLSTRYRVRATGGNLNNELGIPLTVIGDFADRYYEGGGTVGFWFSVLCIGWWRFLIGHEYPEVLVLEFGADRPGDIRRLTERYRPHVAVITHIGAVPVHVEFFASPRELAHEKRQIVRMLESQDYAVLGSDDLTVLEMRSATQGRVRTFGLGEGADVRVVHCKPRLEGTRPLGISFDIESDGHAMPVMIHGTLGEGLARAAAAAVAVGQAMDIGLADAAQALSGMTPPAGRMRVVEGIRNTIIIDDTYNASPSAMHMAIDTVRHLPATRHMLVLGDMRELGSHSVQAHQAIGTLAADVADILICVGEQSKFMADAAANQLSPESIHHVADSREAGAVVQQLLRAGDLVLVKGSQGVRMERVVQEIMARPEQSGRLLVRQSARWLAK